jgi:hypothetical protein
MYIKLKCCLLQHNVIIALKLTTNLFLNKEVLRVVYVIVYVIVCSEDIKY